LITGKLVIYYPPFTVQSLLFTIHGLGIYPQISHIYAEQGKDFYDAVVRIDRISAVIFRVRG
jgi:hypothetical protein